jgi:hypothetical protein
VAAESGSETLRQRQNRANRRNSSLTLGYKQLPAAVTLRLTLFRLMRVTKYDCDLSARVDSCDDFHVVAMRLKHHRMRGRVDPPTRPMPTHTTNSHPKINSMIMVELFALVRLRGAEGSRTPTGWNLNPVPLPVGLRPRCCTHRVAPASGGPVMTCRVSA